MSSVHVDGFGSIALWGFSPSLDLLALHEQGLSTRKSAEVAVESDCFSVLLVGSGDLRHILSTLANASSHPRHASKPIHFYVVESSLEVLARHMLFLTLLMEPPEVVGLQEKAEIFLELYGNSLLRAYTSEYLRTKATELIKMITDDDYCKACLPVLDTSQLKFKERDFLEGIFKFWRNTDDKTFNIPECWDNRLRHHLGVRYDTRSGVYDWDYHMKLKEMAPSINCREYSEWRDTGLAFRLRKDAPYEVPNRTLASGLLLTQGGEKIASRGYWGDIVNSPYLSFGIQLKNMDLFKEQNLLSGASISHFNLISLIHKLTTGEEYASSFDIAMMYPSQCVSRPQDSSIDSNQHGTVNKVKEENSLDEKLKGPLFTGSCNIVTFLPLESVPQLHKKGKYQKLFNIAYFSNSTVHHLKSGIEAVFAPDCTLILETAQFMLDLKKEQKAQYEAKITGMAGALGFKVGVATGDDPTSAHLAFVLSS